MFCWQFGGERQLEAFFSPMSGSEPVFEPKKWNNKMNIRKTHNCYAYVFDIINPNFSKKPQPGYASGYKSLSDDDIRSCDRLMDRLMADNPSITAVRFEDSCPEGYRKAFLAVDDSEDPDYHFYRLDDSGYWSHKPGATPATMLDGRKKMIRNPRQADRKGAEHHYKKPCTYFCYDPKQSKISNQPRKKKNRRGGRRKTGKRTSARKGKKLRKKRRKRSKSRTEQ